MTTRNKVAGAMTAVFWAAALLAIAIMIHATIRSANASPPIPAASGPIVIWLITSSLDLEFLGPDGPVQTEGE